MLHHSLTARSPFILLPALLVYIAAALSIGPVTINAQTDDTSAEAATTVVTNTNDSGPGSLRQAITDAGPNGTVTFAPALTESGVPQLITLTSGRLHIFRGVTILGPGADMLTVSGGYTHQVFHVEFFQTLNLSGITVSEGGDSGIGPTAISMQNGTITLNGVVVSGNVAGGLSTEAGTVTIANSTFTGNGRTAIAGGNGNLVVTNSTISGNLGYGISSLGTVTVNNSTITNNAWAGLAIFGCYATIGSSIIAGNLNSATQPDIVFDTGLSQCPFFTSNGYNLIGNRGAIVFNGPGDQAGTATNIFKPLLGPLRNNGGPVPTHLPRPGSRAIDAGNSFGLSSDQRGPGYLRTVDLSRANAAGGDGTDIGAVELQSEPPPTTAGIYGRLRRPSGTALANTRVYAFDSEGRRVGVSTTSSFGEFSFLALPVGQTYRLGVSSKRYRFPVSTVFLDADLGVTLTGLE